MAKNRSAIKRARFGRTQALRNASRKSAMKTAVKRFEEALAAGEQSRIEATFKTASRLIDKVASKGVIHPNKRDRKKAQLAEKYHAFSQKTINEG